MEEWKRLRKKQIFIESIGISLILIIIFATAVADFMVSKGFVWHTINDIDSFSSILLQIQASMGTLTIALVALISGNISDSYMGIAIGDYYLNIRPSILKQKRIILLSLGLLVMGVVSHIFGWYNLVFGLFVATVALISISVYEIYSIFSGKRSWQKEIESYITFIMESNKGYQKKVELSDSFVKDWEESIENQDTVVYERYVEIFCGYIGTLLKAETKESVEEVEKLCFSIAETFLKSDKSDVKKKGVQFLNRIYENLWEYILNNRDSVKKLPKNFTLFGNLQIEFQDAINEIPIEIIEKIVNWNDMSNFVERVFFWISDRSKQDDTLELEGVNYISRFWGVYIRRQQLKGNIVNQNYWSQVLENLYLTSAYNVPENQIKEFLHCKVELYFNYFYGLITNGLGNIVKEGLYLRGMGSLYEIENHCEAVFYLAIQCYLYYLSERENEDCVSPEIRQDAKQIIQDNKVKLSNEYILRLLTYKEELLNPELEKDLCELLSRFERSSRYSNVKTLIMKDVVREFFIFIILYMQNKSYMPQLIERAVDMDRIEEYYLKFLGEKEEETKDNFRKLFMLYNIRGLPDEEVNEQVNCLYTKLEEVIKKKYKEKSIERVEKYQAIYEEKGEEPQIILDIKDRVKAHLKEKFSPIIAENDNEEEITRLHLLSCNIFTKNLKADIVEKCYWDIDGALINGLTYILQKRGSVYNKNKIRDFVDDVEYINYLKQNDMNTLLGSEYIIKNLDYKQAENFKKYAENCECIYTGFVKYGLALNSDDVKISLHDINVSIHSLTLGEITVDYDEEKQRYIYEISHAMPVEFTKDELKSFIHNERKVLDISVKISVVTEKEKVGVVLTSNKENEFV